MTDRIILALWFFFLGSSLGSFYLVLAERIPVGRNPFRGRSECGYCHTQLKAKDLIPVVSYIRLGGKCRYCGKKLSPVYLTAELLMGSLFVFGFLHFGARGDWREMVLRLVLWSFLFTVSAADLKYSLIPDEIVLAFGILGLFFSLQTGRELKDILRGAVCGLAAYGLVYVLTRLILKKEGFGQGDVTFLTGIGFFLPWQEILVTGLLAFYVALIPILAASLHRREKREIPFGPSVAAAAFVLSVCGGPILTGLNHWLGFAG